MRLRGLPHPRKLLPAREEWGRDVSTEAYATTKGMPVTVMLVRVSHRLSELDWEAMDVMMNTVYAKADVTDVVYSVRSLNELPFIEHALDIGIPTIIRLSSFDQVVALTSHALRLLKAIDHPRSRLQLWINTDRKTSQLRWELSDCDLLAVVRDLGDWQLYVNDVDLALEHEITPVCVDLARGRTTKIRRKEG